MHSQTAKPPLSFYLQNIFILFLGVRKKNGNVGCWGSVVLPFEKQKMQYKKIAKKKERSSGLSLAIMTQFGCPFFVGKMTFCACLQFFLLATSNMQSLRGSIDGVSRGCFSLINFTFFLMCVVKCYGFLCERKTKQTRLVGSLWVYAHSYPEKL